MGRREDIDNAIWDDPEFAELSPDATLLYLWSFTNPRCGMAGLYKVTHRAMTESKVALDRIPAALEELAAAGFAFYEERVLWIRTRVKHLRSRSPQMARAVANDLRAVGPEHCLWRRFMEMYGAHAWLRDELKRTYDEGIGNLSEKPVVASDSDRFPGTYREVPGQGQGKGQDLNVGSKERHRVNQDELPSAISEELKPVVPQVLGVLTAVHDERGGNEPSTRGVGLALAAFPDRDHVGVAKELEHWTLAGTGQRRPVKDLVRLYRTFLERAPVGKPAAASRQQAKSDDWSRQLDAHLERVREAQAAGLARGARAS